MSGPVKALPLQKGDRILVRANNWIGDVIMATPALRALRASRPDAAISVLAKPWVIPALSHNADIDRILTYDAKARHKGIFGLHRLARDLRGEGFHSAILLQRAFEAAWIAFSADIPCRAGFATDARGFLLTHSVKAPREVFLIHRVEHNLHLLERLGIPADRRRLVLPVGKHALASAIQRLEEQGIGPDTFLFGLNPGATFGTAKRWIPERFAALADRLSEPKSRGILFGGPGERELGDAICQATESGRLLNLAGLTTLEEAIALIGLCGLFVTNDSGLMHVAAALDVPLVALFGPTDAGATSPWCERSVLIQKREIGCIPCMKRDCPLKHHLCMDAISLKEVLETTQTLLEAHGRESVTDRLQKVDSTASPVNVVKFPAP